MIIAANRGIFGINILLKVVICKSQIRAVHMSNISQRKKKRKKLHRCCFTGHRPEKLNRPEREIKLELKKEICRVLEDNFTVFISGMARGVDIWAAEIVLQLRKDGIPVRLICACPYPGFERNLSNIWKTRYTAILNAADLY